MSLAEQLRDIADQLPPHDETAETLRAQLEAAIQSNDELLLKIERLILQRDEALAKARTVDQENTNLRLAIARIGREFVKATEPKGTTKP